MDLFGHAFPNDSIRERDLMIAIGCGKGADTIKVARLSSEQVVDPTIAKAPDAADVLLKSLQQAGTPRDSTAKKKP